MQEINELQEERKRYGVNRISFSISFFPGTMSRIFQQRTQCALS